MDGFRLVRAECRGGMGNIYFGGWSSIAAVAKYFEMDERDARNIFTFSAYLGRYHYLVSPSEVAAMIESYLASGL
jgi:hypothetical protein